MAYRGTYYVQQDFTGGYCGNLPATDLALNQASDLDNIVIGPEGKSFRTTWPTIRLNATVFGSADSYPVIGVGSLLTGGSEYILAIKNGKAYGATASGASRDTLTFVDRTGAITISAGPAYSSDLILRRWTFSTFNDLLICFGGNTGTFGVCDAPFKWQGGANNIAALGGSPPSALFGFSANNRMFAGNAAASKQTIYWSILGNAEDWTGVGSGSAVVGSLADGEPLTGAAVLPNQVAILFKSNSIHQMDLSAAPFGNFLLFKDVGALCPGAIVPVDGEIYFVDKHAKMRSTNGVSIKEYPQSANNIVYYSAFNVTYPYPYVYGYRTKTAEYDWIVWVWLDQINFPNSPLYKTVIWDLKNKCWLRCSTGFGFTSGAQGAYCFMGGSPDSGRVFTPDARNYGINDTDGTTSITSYWRTPWIAGKTLENITSIRRVGLDLETKNPAGAFLSNSWTVNYGYDFVPDTGSFTIDASPDDVEDQTFRYGLVKGRGGNVAQFKFSWVGSLNNMAARVNNILYAGKNTGETRRI